MKSAFRFLLIVIAIYTWFAGITIPLTCLVNGTPALLAAGLIHIGIAVVVTLTLWLVHW
jgi:hypothetical protein